MMHTKRSLCLTAVFTVLVAVSFFARTAEHKLPEIPFLEDWQSSPHADFEAEPFSHWNDEGVVSKDCAGCHSTTGHLDFLGVDGSAVGTVEKDAPIEEGVACVACHNTATLHKEAVLFPSGIEVERFEPDARCMDCHQGRSSGIAVDKMVQEAAVTDDTTSDKLKFLNIHYSAAGATRFGAEVHGGYQYSGQKYAGFYFHDEMSTQCNDCHNNHTLKIDPLGCQDCHESVVTKDDFANIRDLKGDFDGDGNTEEGIKYEVQGLEELLLSAMTRYATDVVGSEIAYDVHTYPYFFNDLNANGKVDEDEANRKNGYSHWTPRLAKAAYNYQFALKDHGAYMHNASYVLQLMHDSVMDLGQKVTVPKLDRP
ncbi:hypothetical protein [Gynuella sp.]|uniref:hypothetical protein n=1 Tax=Gynuella sp. TaxID=2969146 RepID=UPI003D0D2D92